ncbi:MAG TPA: HNH endonuclease signature motif containing protein [Candidatus Limnocylindrales bacterium]|nr:HNH endonuclease signature motif containing protein [Candidatus Limnocylindrales bacterium]
MSTRRATSGGWVKRTRGHCRWCGSAVPKGRFTFCGEACVHEWKLRTDPGYLRDKVFERDRGVCALCGLDTEAVRKSKRKLDFAARREFEDEWGRRKSLWDADHIRPVAQGGGECDLSNIRTLCLKCHRVATAALRQLLKEKRSGTSAGNLDAQEKVEIVMPGKKAHKPRNIANAGMHGVHKPLDPSRKSTGQTDGQFDRDMKGRKGQFGGAGDSPLTKK